VDRGAVGTVRREVDLDHRIVEPGIGRVGNADRRILGQVDDAVVIVGNFEFRRRAQHARALDAADGADSERDVLAGNICAGRREHALHAGAGIRGAADHLDRSALARIDHAHAQAIGVGVLLGGDHIRHFVGRQRLRLVLDLFDFQADAGERLDDVVEGGRGVEMILQPGEGEFHCCSPLRK
jgi:hypothetical protein